jgi:hypothetical protein
MANTSLHLPSNGFNRLSSMVELIEITERQIRQLRQLGYHTKAAELQRELAELEHLVLRLTVS